MAIKTHIALVIVSHNLLSYILSENIVGMVKKAKNVIRMSKQFFQE